MRRWHHDFSEMSTIADGTQYTSCVTPSASDSERDATDSHTPPSPATLTPPREMRELEAKHRGNHAEALAALEAKHAVELSDREAKIEVFF